MIGLVFSEEKDATLFYKKITNRKAEKGMRELRATRPLSILMFLASIQGSSGTEESEEGWKD